MIGIIGIGHIGKTLLDGLLNGTDLGNQFSVYDVNEEVLKKYEDNKAVKIHTSNKDVVKESDIIFLCVKPYQFEELTLQLNDHLRDEQLIVSVAPDFSLASLQQMFSHKKVMRMMPSTMMQVKRGVIAISKTVEVKETDTAKFQLLMQDMGYLFWTDERGINQTIGVAGSGIAFAYQLIEAMGQGGVYNGLNAEEAYKMAAETLIGAGEMLLKTNEHPAKLRDQVCTPGGLTIQGITKLEELGFKHAVIEAVKATYQKEE